MPTDDDAQDADVPALAVEALRRANERVVSAGHPRVLVRDGRLVRIEGGRVVVLKELPARRRVTIRTLRRES